MFPLWRQHDVRRNRSAEHEDGQIARPGLEGHRKRRVLRKSKVVATPAAGGRVVSAEAEIRVKSLAGYPLIQSLYRRRQGSLVEIDDFALLPVEDDRSGDLSDQEADRRADQPGGKVPCNITHRIGFPRAPSWPNNASYGTG